MIERAGRRVDGFAAGDRVTFDSMVSCGACDFCRRGQINLCDNRMVLGVSCGDYRRHGAFAEYVSVPARILYKLPENLPFERAALTEAVSIAVHAVNRHVPAADETAVVVGAGMIGLLAIQVLRVKGVRTIVAVDVDERKLELARRMGAAHALNATAVDVTAAVNNLTGGRGADAAFEVAGIGDTVATAVRSVRKGGIVVLIGNLSPAVGLPLQWVVTREISVLGSCGSNGEIPECIDLLARGAIDVDPIISVRAPLDAGPDLFARLYVPQGSGRIINIGTGPSGGGYAGTTRTDLLLLAPPDAYSTLPSILAKSV